MAWVFAPFMGTFWKVLLRAGVEWMWTNPHGDCASPQMWMHNLSAPAHLAAVEVHPCFRLRGQMAHTNAQPLFCKGVIIVPAGKVASTTKGDRF